MPPPPPTHPPKGKYSYPLHFYFFLAFKNLNEKSKKIPLSYASWKPHSSILEMIDVKVSFSLVLYETFMAFNYVLLIL